MNANAKLWVEALRSGKYKQTTCALEDHQGSCCLGVACRVAIEQGVDVTTHKDSNRLTFFEDSRIMIPTAVQNWLRLQTSLGEFSDVNGENSLAGINDDGATFEQIADIIESEPPGLFVEE